MSDISVYVYDLPLFMAEKSSVTIARGQICSEVLSLFLLYIHNRTVH
jgi:hypothetical protein